MSAVALEKLLVIEDDRNLVKLLFYLPYERR